MKNNQNSQPNFVPSILKVVASEECANSVANDLNILESDQSIEDLLNDQQKEEPQEKNT